MELIEGVLQHFMQIISNQCQIFKDVDDNQVVRSVRDILQKRFTTAASLEILELGEVGKYIVIEKKEFYQGSGKLQTCYN